MFELNKIYQGNALEILKTFPSEIIDCVVTSPPYYGLRLYGNYTSIFGGDKDCEHNWTGANRNLNDNDLKEIGTYSNFCNKCNAWKGQLGQEPTFQMYLDHLLMIFGEIKRVLKSTGTIFVNLGDSYSGSMNGKGDKTSTNRGKDESYKQKYQGQNPGKQIKDKCLLNIPSRFAIRMTDELGFIQRNEIIWYKRNCLSGDTQIYAKTQKGIIISNLKDLIRLRPETVELWDGKKWNKVKEWLKNSEPKNIKKITFRNNNKIVCTEEHKFPVGEELIKAKDLKIGDVVNNCKLPDNNYTIKHLPDDIGRFIGLYLAEGSLGNKNHCIQFASHVKNTDRYNYLQKIAISYGSNCTKYNKINKSCTMNIYSSLLISIIKEYVKGNNAHNKYLTNKVWKRNDEFLKQLLMGYLEGDGHYETKNKKYRICFCRNKSLASNLRTLCARLKYKIKLQEGYTKLNNKLYSNYIGEIRLNNDKSYNQKSDYQIKNIEIVKKTGNFWDIVLEEEPHLFADSSGTLIHNCMPSSVKDRFTIDFEKIYFFVKSKKYYFEQQFEPVKQISIDRLNRALSNQNKWAKGCEGQTPQGISRPRESKIHKSGDNKGSENNYAISTYKFDKEDYLAMPSNSQGRNKRCVWDMPTKGYSGAHFATFSTSLIEPMIKAGCPEFICNKCEKPKEKIYYSKVIGKQSPIGGKKHVGNNGNATYSGNTKLTEKQFLEYTDCECNSGFHGGIVLGPFMGAGTTAKETIKQNKNYIGIEINPKYVELSNKRLEKINKQIKIKYD